MRATSVVMTEDFHNDSRLTRPVSLMAFRLLACWTLKGRADIGIPFQG